VKTFSVLHAGALTMLLHSPMLHFSHPTSKELVPALHLTSVILFPDVLACHALCVNQVPVLSTQLCSYHCSAVASLVHSPNRLVLVLFLFL